MTDATIAAIRRQAAIAQEDARDQWDKLIGDPTPRRTARHAPRAEPGALAALLKAALTNGPATSAELNRVLGINPLTLSLTARYLVSRGELLVSGHTAAAHSQHSRRIYALPADRPAAAR